MLVPSLVVIVLMGVLLKKCGTNLSPVCDKTARYQCDVVDADMTSAARRREQTTDAPANTCRECASVRRYAVVASQTERHPDVVD